MTTPQPEPQSERHTLKTTEGEFALEEYRLHAGGREWSILNTGTMLTLEDEQRFFRELRDRLPYGVALWPAAVALAHEIAGRADEFRGKRVLELGAGTGIPGIVAASLGAHVVQTDRMNIAMSICKRNAERNNAPPIEYRLVDWDAWDDTTHYDWIIGSDILYVADKHARLQHIFETNRAPNGGIMIADPFRDVSITFLDHLETQGWTVWFNRWQIGAEPNMRNIGLFEIAPPANAG